MAKREIEVTIRPKNQITLPAEIAERLGVRAGDRILFSLLESEELPRVEVRPLRRSYAGILRGVYGETEEEIEAYVRGERESWDE
ncbi:MAG: AbrB/MazE/SpoVT family DNA-binding domain-containing protein [bacterium]|nr:AbrB/MazE/SpoVT family DNA-binding domain-containing protein [bacterium]